MFWSLLMGAWAMMRFWVYPGGEPAVIEVLKTHSFSAITPTIQTPMIDAAPMIINSLPKPAKISQGEYVPFNRFSFGPAFQKNYSSAPVTTAPREWQQASSLPAVQMPFPADFLLQSAPLPESAVSAPATIAPRKFKRLDIYAYSFVRPGALQEGALAATPQYGGGQSGIIAAYRLTSGSAPDIALLGRVSAAHGGSRSYEFAAGARIKPLKSVPVSLSIERRFRPNVLDVTALYAAGSKEDIHLPIKLSARGYAQAGIILGPQKDQFYDAGIRIDRPLMKALGGQLHLGVGSWAGGQRGAGRIDIGPALRTEVKLGNIPLHLTADWRFRVAGNAAPGNGPAITLSAGF
jgi:hypothetical protein